MTTRPLCAAVAGVLALMAAGCSGSDRPAHSPTAGTTPAVTGVASAEATRAPQPSPSPPRRGPFIAQARWQVRRGVRTLTLTPTAAGRDHPHPDALWRDVVRRVPDANTPGMRDQLVCHSMFAPAKAVWHLEPGRPAVGMAATIAARCNPGTLVDPDDG